MFITKPIKSFKFDNNKVSINESVIEYEPISDDDKEILESLISKGAYGSALLTLNTKYNVKSINESKYTHKDYVEYLTECNNLMKECVSETKAHNFRPLINLNGLEIMESADHIARGKGDKLLIEDFRMQEECEGTQCSDIAEKKDQEVGSLQKPKKPKKRFTEMFSVPKNHGFKGFRLDEQGHYVRGNYVLINENGIIKAVNKNKLQEEVNSKLNLLLTKLQASLKEGLEAIGYDEEFMRDYCSIYADDEGGDPDYTYIHFTGELDYQEGENVTYYHLNPVLQEYDANSYFEAVDSGRWIAMIRNEYLN